jgi:hypothetical protein
MKRLSFLFLLATTLTLGAQPQVLTNATMVTTWSDSLARGQFGQRQNIFLGSYFINNYPQYFVSYRDHSESGDNNLGMATNRVPRFGTPDAYSLGTTTNGLNFYYVSDNSGYPSNGPGLQNITATFNILAKAPTNTYTRLGFATNDFPHGGGLFNSIFIGEIAEQSGDGTPAVRDSSYGARNVGDSNGIPFVDSWNNLVGVVTTVYATNTTAYWFENGHPGNELQLIWALTTLTYPTNNYAGLGADTNSYTAIIDFNAATVSLTNHCTATGLSKSGNALTFTFRADRMAPGFYVPDGVQTNDCRKAFALMPPLGNAFCEMLRVTNLPAGNYWLNIDGSNCVVISSAQLAAGYNNFTNYSGAFWAQKKEVLGLMLDAADVNRATASDDVTVGNVFNTAYESYANVVWATNAVDTTLYATQSDMMARESEMKTQDVLIHNATQQTNHTITVSLIVPRAAPYHR